MPREEPVTQATFPEKGRSLVFMESPRFDFLPKVSQKGSFVNSRVEKGKKESRDGARRGGKGDLKGKKFFSQNQFFLPWT